MKTNFTMPYLILMLLLSATTVFATNTMLVAPSNDLIENAINLNWGPTVPYNESDVNFPEATNTNDHTPPLECPVSAAGIWYKFTPTKNGNIAAGILNPDGAAVIFYEGPANATNGNQLTHVDQNSNPCASNPIANINASEGVTYYIYMRNVVVSDVIINTSSIFQIPANDLIENATDIALVSQPLTDNNIHFLVTTNTNDGDQTNCPSGNFDGVWYKITTEEAGTIDAIMEGSASGESAMIFYSAPNANATSGAELTWVDQPSNACGLFNATSIEAEEGVTYYLYAFSAHPYANVIINASAVLGISENVLEGFKFFPNPANNELNLSAKNNIEQVSIYNLLGQQVFSEKMNATYTTLNISNLSKGMYVMNVTSDGNTASFKILKE